MAVFEAFLAASLRCCGPRSPDPPGVDALETSLRKLRDVLIGNRGRKAECVDAGCVAPLLAVASSSQTAVARSLAACCLCSLAHGVRDRVLALDPMPALLDCVGGSSSDKKTVENALRAIRALVAGSGGSPAVVEARRAVLSRCASLVAMLDYAGQPRTASLITDILASICVDSKAQEVLLGLGVSSKLIGVLVSGNLGTGQSASHSDLDKGAKLRTRLCVAVLSALAALTRNNAASSEPLCDAGTGHGSFAIRTLFRLTRDRNSHLRLLSSMCLTNLFETGCLPPDFLPYISRSALPSIVKLLSEPARSDLHVPTCDTLRRLVNSEELQQRAMDFDAVEKLALLLETTLPIHAGVFGNQSGPNSAPGAGNPIVETPNLLLESILSALAAVSSLKEEPRRRIVDANLMPRIVVLLDHPDPRVHTAACQCLMSLSRSIKALRSDFVGTEVSRPLLRLLEIGDAQSQSAASGALCNILLDTSSPAKKDVIDSGAVAVLVGLTDSADMGLRLNGLWAIKNLCYRATSQIKASIMEQLTWSRLDSLLRDGQPAVREQATSLLRNLLCNKESDIDEGFKGLGDRLLDGIEGNLSGAQVSDRIALHSLYVVANLATGSLQHKESIMNRLSLLKSVLAYTNHTQIGVRMAALWVVANLTWPDEPGLLQRIHRLRGMGFHEQLVKMNCSDLDVEVKDKVRQVLQQFAMEQRDGRETCVQ